MTAEAPEGVPLTILGGFLGAGKTTLLNHLLTSDHGLRIAVLVNDFGAINIDAELVVGVQDGMMSLANGCVCCEIRDDLLEAVERLVESSTPPEHIVLEASGVADPAGIWATFAGSSRRDWVRLDGVICVVDSEQLFTRLDEAPELLMFKARQIGFADLVVLNKVDLAGPETVAWIRKWIDETMDRVRIVEAVQAEVPLEILLGVGRADQGHDPEAAHDHGHPFRTLTYEVDRPLDGAELQRVISTELPGSVYRCKGFVHVDGDPPQRMLLQAVGRRSQLTAHPAPAGESGRTRIVAIGTDELEMEDLHSAFDRCLVGT